MPHHFTVIFGECAVRRFTEHNCILNDDNVEQIELEGEVQDFSFETLAERDAFIKGVRYANGHGDFAIVDNDLRSWRVDLLSRASAVGEFEVVTAKVGNSFSVKINDDVDVSISYANRAFTVSCKYVHDSTLLGLFSVEQSND